MQNGHGFHFGKQGNESDITVVHQMGGLALQ